MSGRLTGPFGRLRAGPFGRLRAGLGFWVLVLGRSASAEPPKVVPAGEEPLVELTRLDPKIQVDLVYATSENFAGVKLYPVARCLLREGVAKKIAKAQVWLDQHRPGWLLRMKDCYRPDAAQWLLFRAVKGTSKARYVADPRRPAGSLHSRGASVDVTLSDGQSELDMGTPHDFLGELAEPRHESRFVSNGSLSARALENRRALRAAMRWAGMRGILREWWHFDDDKAEAVVAKYSRLDVPLEP
ncbi:MAG: M15 family metallopeptidase [Deltaproteobacteria bacterium]|nr:M15 family metallopeptidase [Deltaproteobacteria bacterium]